MPPPLGAGDGDDVLALGQQPGQRQLGGGAALGLGGFDQRPDQGGVGLQGAVVEARMVPAPVAFRQVPGTGDGAGQHPPAQRRIGHEADPQLAADRQDVVLDEAAPQGIFGLQGGDGMHRVGPAEGVDAGLRQAEEAHLALLDQPFHGADGVLDRHRRIDPVLVVEIDGLDPEALQALLAGLHDVFGPAVDPEAAIGGALVAELGGDHRLAAIAIRQGPLQQLLIGAQAVHVGGVQEVRAPIQRFAHRGDGFIFVESAVDRGHGHAAEPQGGNLQPLPAELAHLHVGVLLRIRPSIGA